MKKITSHCKQYTEMSNLFYDGEWLVSLSNLPGIDMSQYNGAMTANGKIGFYTSMADLSTTKTYISANFTFNQIGKYKNNLIQGFDMNKIKFIHNTDNNISYDFVHQSLDMSKGHVETKFNVMSNSTLILKATHHLVPLRQYPFCVLQTIEFRTESNMTNLDIFHEISGNANFINEMNFNNNVIYNERIYEDNGLYILNAEGNLNRLGNEGRPTKIAGASCYFFEVETNIKKLGFNVYNNLNACYQKIRWLNLSSNVTYKFHILSAQMSGFDFPDPLDEVKRILLNISFREQNIGVLTSLLSSENLLYWNKIWKSDVLIEPKTGITNQELLDVQKVKQYLRYSMFNILASIRDGVNTEVNPLNLSYLDANGNVFFDGDLWMVPILLFLKPDMSKTLLEYRYKNLEQATQLAASFGLKGCKFPYQDDVVGYQSTYWDVVSPLHVFNNALIAINVWNYYRVTFDKEWLANKGYQMMKNIADFIVSMITIDEEGKYNIYNVAGMSERISLNPAMTTYMFKLALKYIIEASYELNFAPKKAWTDSYLNLDIVTLLAEGECGVIAYDDEYNAENLDIIDHLIILFPYYSSLFFDPNKPCRDAQSLLTNLEYYISRISNKYLSDPLNNMIISMLYGVVMQTDITKVSTFYTSLVKVFQENIREVWGHFNRVDAQQGNDITLNALFVMMFLNGIGGLRIEGGVTESKFYYEEFGIKGKYFANMPNTWKNIRLKGIGASQELYNVVNTQTYS
jgi:trehalose/maltose hydrolase-like predicted phosphorylase